jgi:tetratricopeptide (TPR) repeat protein
VRPLLADLHSWRGTQALSRGDALAALARYETATRYQPHRAPYRVALALTDAQLGRFEKAQREMKVAIGLRPTDPVLLRQLAAVYARQALALDMPSKLALAYAAYEQAIALAPTIAVTYQEYADLALRAGDDTIALTQATQAVTLDATDGVSFGIIGWAQLQAENVPAALGAFEQAVRWLPDSADFQLGLATAHFMAGNDMAARLAVAQSLRIDPTYAPALALQRQLDDD